MAQPGIGQKFKEAPFASNQPYFVNESKGLTQPTS